MALDQRVKIFTGNVTYDLKKLEDVVNAWFDYSKDKIVVTSIKMSSSSSKSGPNTLFTSCTILVHYEIDSNSKK